PAHRVHALPAHVRDHHAGADHGRLRRAQEVLGLPALHGAVGDLRVRPPRALGVGRRRLAQEAGRARLRRRHRRAHLVGHVRARVRARARPAAWLRPPADAATQPAHDGDGRRAAVVRLVRLQRGQRARGQRPRGQRVSRHQQRRVGGGATWGALATGLFASKAINEGGADGLFFGNPGQLWTQLVAVVATIVLAVVLTWVILKVVDAIVGLRVSDEDEVAGLDLSQHSETAYALGGGQYGEFSSATGPFADAMRAA